MNRADRLLVSQGANSLQVAALSGTKLIEFFYHSDHSKLIKGNVYVGKVVRIVPGMQAAFVDIGLEKNGFLAARDVINASDAQNRHRVPEIQALLHEGQLITVQVITESREQKGPKLSMNVSFANRSFAYLHGGQGLSFSNKLNDSDSKERIQNSLSELIPEVPMEGALVVRTAAANRLKAELVTDFHQLVNQSRSLCSAIKSARSPICVYQQPSFLVQLVTEQLLSNDALTSIVVDQPSHLEEVQTLVQEQFASSALQLTLFNEHGSLFESQEVGHQVDRALNSRVDLKNGGQLVIQTTEALTAIDVNSHAFLKTEGGLDFHLALNLEALAEIQYQLRLRNLSGVIVIDFVDMVSAEDVLTLERELAQWSTIDPKVSNLGKVSQNGLVELTRRRDRPSLAEQTSEFCDHCAGLGRIKSKEVLLDEIVRALRASPQASSIKSATIISHPNIIEFLQQDAFNVINDVGEHLGCEIRLRTEPHYHLRDYDIVIA